MNVMTFETVGEQNVNGNINSGKDFYNMKNFSCGKIGQRKASLGINMIIVDEADGYKKGVRDSQSNFLFSSSWHKLKHSSMEQDIHQVSLDRRGEFFCVNTDQ